MLQDTRASFDTFAFNHVIKVPFISLVNLIAGREVVSELFADRFTYDNICADLRSLLPGGNRRAAMLEGYDEVFKAWATPRRLIMRPSK